MSVLGAHRRALPHSRRLAAAAPITRSATDVLRELARLEAVAVDAPAQVATLHDRAHVVAGEHGHELGEWLETDHLLTSAHCLHCTATVCLRTEGYGSNAQPLEYLQVACARTRARFFIRGTTTAPKVWRVFDRERMAYGPLDWSRKKGDAQKMADARNGGPAVVSPAFKALADVERLRAQLARAEAKLESITGASVSRPTTQEVAAMPKKPKVAEPSTARSANGAALDAHHKRSPASVDIAAPPPHMSRAAFEAREVAAAAAEDAPKPRKPRASRHSDDLDDRRRQRREKSELAAKLASEGAIIDSRAPGAATAAPTARKLPGGLAMAEAVLHAAERPMRMAELAARVLEIDGARAADDRAYKGKTPAASLSAKVSVSARDGGAFVKVAPGVFGLREWPADMLDAARAMVSA